MGADKKVPMWIKVSKERFDEFVRSYPGELEWGTDTLAERFDLWDTGKTGLSALLGHYTPNGFRHVNYQPEDQYCLRNPDFVAPPDMHNADYRGSEEGA